MMIPSVSAEFGRGKTIGVLALVVGCFAILWPKLFYPMFSRSGPEPRASLDPALRPDEVGQNPLLDICKAVAASQKISADFDNRATQFSTACQRTVEANCGVFLDPGLAQEFVDSRNKKARVQQSTALWNLTTCLSSVYGVTPKNMKAEMNVEVEWKLAVERQWRRGERTPYLHPGMMNPAMREKGQVPHGIHHPGDAPPKPSDLSGKPSLGGPGQMVPPQRPGGTMSMIMPLYTIAIVVFFVYTVMKIMFKKDQDQSPKDRRLEVLDPDHRRLIQEYESSTHDYIELWKERNEKEETPLKIEDVEIENLRQRLADTEAAMQRMMATISTVSDRLMTTAKNADIVLPSPPPIPAPTTSSDKVDCLALLLGSVLARALMGIMKEMDEYRAILTKEKEKNLTSRPSSVDSGVQEGEDASRQEGVDVDAEGATQTQIKDVLEADNFTDANDKPTPKPSPTLSKKHIHFSENTHIGVRDVQTAAQFRRSRSRSKERLLDLDTTDDMLDTGNNVSSIILDAALRRDAQMLVSEAECRALPLEEQSASAVGDSDDVTPVVLSGKMTISFLGAYDEEGADGTDGNQRNGGRFGGGGEGGGPKSYLREESDPGPYRDKASRRSRKWAGQKKIRKRRSSTPTSTRSLEEEELLGDDEDGGGGRQLLSGGEDHGDASIMDNLPELPDDEPGPVSEDRDAEDGKSAGDEPWVSLRLVPNVVIVHVCCRKD
ncbi:unnamed protein product [Notodromas monacha]|uniref:Resistance to inhibitors of cholinesterase protein 3 N-terminal domain-containing protein n=1 Tax=Notodromas monacha TaxID=399045 RepID=A0A7R9GF18_9CRUS|nr:unnamed protein product [Notodromas monacha]CAG0918651.1 unnamed protein product [Notodromas monacha]